jgi:DNA processing protein
MKSMPSLDLDVIKELSGNLSEEEALMILSCLDFSMGDFSAIKKLGGVKALLATSLMIALINRKAALNRNLLMDFRRQFDEFYRGGGFIISPFSWPKSRLFASLQAPIGFLGRYNKDLLDISQAAAVVGSRQASPNALHDTKNLVKELVNQEIVIVSGGATGIDEAAHRAALDYGGKTIIISPLCCNLNPESRVKKWLLPKYEEHVLVIYPFGPLMPQHKFMFIERNRFVVSLAQALVIVQGKIGSGTLHTAKFAKELSVPIFALPGALNDPNSYVPNSLLQLNQARAVSDFAQFASSLRTELPKSPKSPRLGAKNHRGNPDKVEALPYLLQVINDHDNSLGFDELLAITGLPFRELQKELLNYELCGRLIKRGSQFVLTAN